MAKSTRPVAAQAAERDCLVRKLWTRMAPPGKEGHMRLISISEAAIFSALESVKPIATEAERAFILCRTRQDLLRGALPKNEYEETDALLWPEDQLKLIAVWAVTAHGLDVDPTNLDARREWRQHLHAESRELFNRTREDSEHQFEDWYNSVPEEQLWPGEARVRESWRAAREVGRGEIVATNRSTVRPRRREGEGRKKNKAAPSENLDADTSARGEPSDAEDSGRKEYECHVKLEPHIVTNPRHWTKFQAHQLYNDLKAWLLKQAGMVQGMGIRHSDIALTLEERIREELPILIDIVFATKALPRDVRRTITKRVNTLLLEYKLLAFAVQHGNVEKTRARVSIVGTAKGMQPNDIKLQRIADDLAYREKGDTHRPSRTQEDLMRDECPSERGFPTVQVGQIAPSTMACRLEETQVSPRRRTARQSSRVRRKRRTDGRDQVVQKTDEILNPAGDGVKVETKIRGSAEVSKEHRIKLHEEGSKTHGAGGTPMETEEPPVEGFEGQVKLARKCDTVEDAAPPDTAQEAVTEEINSKTEVIACPETAEEEPPVSAAQEVITAPVFTEAVDTMDPYDELRDELRSLESLAADYDDVYNRVESADYEEYRPPEIDGELDVVDVAGHIDLESIQLAARNPASPLFVALWALSSDNFAESLVPRGKIFKGTRREYIKFVRTMVECGLCEKVGRSAAAKAYSGFFTVLKKEVDGVKILRTILNCEPLNQASPKAPPVNLPSLLEVQDAFADCKYLRALDFRHYFHQFKISNVLQQWLHIAIGPARVRWRVLPMGWTWAPFIAEAISWYFAVGEGVNEWEGLPRVYKNAEGVVVVIWYDNVFAGAKDEVALEKFWSEMLQRCAKHKVVIKEQFSAKVGESIDCIGLRWHVTEQGVKWELLEKSKEKLRAVAATLLDDQLPTKQVAKLIGCVVWGLWSQRRALFQLRDAYELLAKAVKTSGWKGKMPTAGLERLGSLARELADDPGLTGVESAKKRIYLASDASLDGYGVVDLDTGNQVRGVWKHVHVTGDMYYLEALAAKRAVMYAPANTEIILITDNMGLVWSLRKRSSRCPRTARVLAEMHEAMEARGQTLRVVHVGTKENPADAPSRGDRAERDKITTVRQRADAVLYG